MDRIASAIRRPWRNSLYIKERQIFADIIHDLGISPAEFAMDVHDFMIDHDILVYSTIKYTNKIRGGWSCIIQLKLTYDIQKFKDKFADGTVTLYNGEKLKVTSCGTYIPSSYSEVICPAKDIKGIPFVKLCKFFPQKFLIKPSDCNVVDKLFIVNCHSMLDAIEMTQSPVSLPNRQLYFRHAVSEDAESKFKTPKKSPVSSPTAIVPYRNTDTISPFRPQESQAEIAIIRGLQNRVDVLENNQHVMAATIVKVSKGQTILNNAILDIYSTMDAQSKLQQISCSIVDYQSQLMEALSTNNFSKVEEITIMLKNLKLARNGQGTIIEMRAGINKSHFEEVIGAQQSLANELKEKAQCIELNENTHIIEPNEKPQTIEETKPEVTASQDPGKKRVITAASSNKKKKTNAPNSSQSKGSDNKKRVIVNLP